ncbi:MAG: hypothetical protein KIT27_04495 [Legionellales bacterium]|nr:hypothetical protein [Legionellales bacterium]
MSKKVVLTGAAALLVSSIALGVNVANANSVALPAHSFATVLNDNCGGCAATTCAATCAATCAGDDSHQDAAD